MDSLEFAPLLETLIATSDPVGAVWKYLVDLWASIEDRDHYFQEGERRTMYLEKVLDAAYPELYTEILPLCCTNRMLDPLSLKAPLVWMDGFSIREAVLLSRDVPGITEFTYSFSGLPSDTNTYRERVFKFIRGKRRELKDLGAIVLDGDEAAVRCPLPDSELENIVGLVSGRSLMEIYEDTKRALLTIMDELGTGRVLVTSDHGYINTRTHFWDAGRSAGALKNVFNGGRYARQETDASALVKKGYIISYGDYYLARGRYAWPTRGKYKVMLHGGVSLLECLVPLIKVEM